MTRARKPTAAAELGQLTGELLRLVGDLMAQRDPVSLEAARRIKGTLARSLARFHRSMVKP